MKFNQNLISKIKESSQKLTETKKNVNFFMETVKENGFKGKKFSISNNLELLRPNTYFVIINKGLHCYLRLLLMQKNG